VLIRTNIEYLIFTMYSVVTRLRCCGIFSDHSVRHSLLSLPVKESWKSVNI